MQIIPRTSSNPRSTRSLPPLTLESYRHRQYDNTNHLLCRSAGGLSIHHDTVGAEPYHPNLKASSRTHTKNDIQRGGSPTGSGCCVCTFAGLLSKDVSRIVLRSFLVVDCGNCPRVCRFPNLAWCVGRSSARGGARSSVLALLARSADNRLRRSTLRKWIRVRVWCYEGRDCWSWGGFV